jgi:hypothetical protein
MKYHKIQIQTLIINKSKSDNLGQKIQFLASSQNPEFFSQLLWNVTLIFIVCRIYRHVYWFSGSLQRNNRIITHSLICITYLSTKFVTSSFLKVTGGGPGCSKLTGAPAEILISRKGSELQELIGCDVRSTLELLTGISDTSISLSHDHHPNPSTVTRPILRDSQAVHSHHDHLLLVGHPVLQLATVRNDASNLNLSNSQDSCFMTQLDSHLGSGEELPDDVLIGAYHDGGLLREKLWPVQTVELLCGDVFAQQVIIEVEWILLFKQQALGWDQLEILYTDQSPFPPRICHE